MVAAEVHDARGHRSSEAANVGDGKGARGDARGNHSREKAIVAGGNEIGGAEGVSETVRKLGIWSAGTLAHSETPDAVAVDCNPGVWPGIGGSGSLPEDIVPRLVRFIAEFV